MFCSCCELLSLFFFNKSSICFCKSFIAFVALSYLSFNSWFSLLSYFIMSLSSYSYVFTLVSSSTQRDWKILILSASESRLRWQETTARNSTILCWAKPVKTLIDYWTLSRTRATVLGSPAPHPSRLKSTKPWGRSRYFKLNFCARMYSPKLSRSGIE